MNAEIVSGTVTNMREAVTWMSYTFCLFVCCATLSYGVTWDEKVDPSKAAQELEQPRYLDDARMVR